ncbi:transcriptional regulator, tetr family [hydrocarbon metagenome]|uniref:Transcriptional regulator, tetr family n=1 Tax=hydrocarbon metagenome TaxID=938273 RepID=A0A0W8G2N2_9ZZZZ
MSGKKVIPIGRTMTTRQRLVASVGRVLAREGFRGFGLGKVALEAGVDRRVISRHFGGLAELVAEFARSPDFWPATEEIRAGMEAAGSVGGPEGQLAAFHKGFLRALVKRPQTLDILAWEMMERTSVSRMLEQARVRVALECFERLTGEVPDNAGLTGIVAVMGAAMLFFAVRARLGGHFGGLDPNDPADLARIDAAVDALVGGVFSRL